MNCNKKTYTSPSLTAIKLDSESYICSMSMSVLGTVSGAVGVKGRFIEQDEEEEF